MQKVTVCGYRQEDLVNNVCYKCGSNTHCTVRKQDWIDERLYNFCKTHNCLYTNGKIAQYYQAGFVEYLRTHPNEIKRRKWLQEYAREFGVI